MSEREHVASLERGLAVIRAFDAERPAMALSEVAAATGLSRATARRFLHTLETLGYVHNDARTFRLTPRVLELGYSYLSALSLPEIAQPHLERLSRRLDESVSAAVLDGDDVVYVARVPVRRIVSVAITIGTRLPAATTSMGHVLTSGEAWAVADEELERGLRAVAAPLHGRAGVIAAVNVSTSTSRVPREELIERHLPALLETAAAIDLELAAAGL
ncbi:MAG TPA: helix-turn-helix domain-containing protein [Microbacteriaceae bacterium]|nr:helix-turn-helix domain-containing protein [Microbacteriaceae bacterium]